LYCIGHAQGKNDDWKSTILSQGIISYILIHVEWILVKEETADWIIYHLVAQKETITTEELIILSGMDADTVHVSLVRLERYMLIERSGNSVRVLTVGEAILKCQINNTIDPGFEIVDGVIKARRK
jgi:hypothetical protein